MIPFKNEQQPEIGILYQYHYVAMESSHTFHHTGNGATSSGEMLELFANRTPEKLESLPKNATALRGRRGAVNRRQAKVENIKGHNFIKKFFRRPTYCSHCREFLW